MSAASRHSDAAQRHEHGNQHSATAAATPSQRHEHGDTSGVGGREDHVGGATSPHGNASTASQHCHSDTSSNASNWRQRERSKQVRRT